MDGGFVDRFDELFAVGYRAAFVVLGQRAEAEDCAQEAMARALERPRRHRPAGADVVDDPVAVRRHDLVRALRALPARQREAVVLRHLVDLSEQETAHAMACTVGTVKSTTARGLDRLRGSLGPSWALEQP